MTSLQLRPALDHPHAEAPSLRVVPEWPAALGAGLLAEEAELDQDLLVRALLPVTHDVLTVVLEPTRPGTFAFNPGQYLTLRVDVDGTPAERCYTISSPPTRPHLLTITVKRVPGGVVSAHLHDRLRVGDVVSASGPLGSFSLTAHPAARYLLLSAGSGVTPTLATVRALADLAELDRTDVVVVHSARTPSDIACRAELEQLAATHRGLRLVWVCEADVADAPGLHEGRLSAELLRREVPELADREVFTCGPVGYMDAARAVLADVGVDPTRCHEESFVLPHPEPLHPEPAHPEALHPEPVEGLRQAQPAGGLYPGPAHPEALHPEAPHPELAHPELVEGLRPAQPAGGLHPEAPHPEPVEGLLATATITFARSGCEVACPRGTTVLAAAEQAGVRLPSSCASGMCGTCKSTLLSGRVDMDHQGGIRPREIAQDRFLPCCSTPDGDIVVDA